MQTVSIMRIVAMGRRPSNASGLLIDRVVLRVSAPPRENPQFAEPFSRALCRASTLPHDLPAVGGLETSHQSPAAESVRDGEQDFVVPRNEW